MCSGKTGCTLSCFSCPEFSTIDWISLVMICQAFRADYMITTVYCCRYNMKKIGMHYYIGYWNRCCSNIFFVYIFVYILTNNIVYI